MKILQVSHTFLPKFVAGTEVYTYEISKGLQEKHEVRVVYTDPLESKYGVEKLKFKDIICYKITKDIQRFFSFEETFLDLKVEKYFIDILNEYKPDVIHYQHLLFLSANIVKEANKRHIKQIISLHDFWFQCLTHKRIKTNNTLCINPTLEDCILCYSDMFNQTLPLPRVNLFSIDGLKTIFTKPYMQTAIKKIAKKTHGKVQFFVDKKNTLSNLKKRLDIMKKTLQSVNVVVFPTYFLQSELYKWKLKGKNDIVSSDGIQDKYFLHFKKKKEKYVRFAFIGSIVQAKGLHVLAEAWKEVKNTNAVLKIYGNFNDDPKYSERVTKILNKCSNITTYGGFPSDKIAEIFKEIDVLIVPSTWYENAPLVIRNALLAKVPVIGTNLGGISEIIEEKKTGFLFENQNSKQLKDKIQFIIDNPSIIKNMENNFPVQKTMRENVREYELLYKKLIHTND